MEDKKSNTGVWKKVTVTLILLLLFLTVAAYLLGVQFFTRHFLPGSMVNGWNCSYMSVEETEQLLDRKIKAYVLTINTRGNGQESITADQAQLAYSSTGEVGRLMKSQNRYQWFRAFDQKTEYQLSTDFTFSTEKLKETVENLDCMQKENTIVPTDAYIRDTGTRFKIVAEKEGRALIPEKVQKVIAEAIVLGITSVDLDKEECYKKPEIYQDNEVLIGNCKRMNELTDIIITYDFADRTETVDRDLIKNWFTEDKDGYCILDKQKIAAYVDDLGYRYDTFGLPRTFTTYDGREITIQGGDYGWVIDQEAETEALMEAIESGVTQVREPVYLYTAWERDSNDIGYTYIEIDINNQRLVFYQDGVPIVDTLVVTGNPGVEGCATPTGCFAIDAKQSPATLTGEDYSSQVSYWLPFYGNVGIHDAAWRSGFGNNLYLFDGSHGCVNVPLDKAALIYQNAEVGMPVVVYE